MRFSAVSDCGAFILADAEQTVTKRYKILRKQSRVKFSTVQNLWLTKGKTFDNLKYVINNPSMERWRKSLPRVQHSKRRGNADAPTYLDFGDSSSGSGAGGPEPSPSRVH